MRLRPLKLNSRAVRVSQPGSRAIFNVVSLIIGILTLIFLVVLFLFPVVGAIGAWLSLVAAIIGAGVGQLSASKAGRNFNIFVIIVALVRLSLGGGLL